MRKWNDDPFTKRARREGFEARSAYKLEEIEKRDRVLAGARLVLDLGAAPGSWTQYVLKTIPEVRVVAVDIQPMTIRDPRVQFFQESIETISLADTLGGEKADVVLSDMAPKTSGILDVDIAQSHELARLALKTAVRFLKPHGHFVCKIFMGETFESFQREMKASFTDVKLLRPESTRKQSKEIFFVGKRFRGGSPLS